MMHLARNAALMIRGFQSGDARSIAAEADNIKIWNNMSDSFPSPYTEEEAMAYIERAQSKSPAQDFAIVAADRAIGGISVAPLQGVERFSAEIGYWIGESYWNRGIASWAVGAFSSYLLSETSIVRLVAIVYEYNRASSRVLEKNGFRLVGVMRKAAFKNNSFVDMLYYERCG
ncbi:MAG: GNAT family N-acetyltransferase [Tannerellaceae bacterium]|jgi:RimJ/RimL family protein N-acetyltransferase|nr:GNAT family N-acetyltransferase [Tannerellaceae bacterium]